MNFFVKFINLAANMQRKVVERSAMKRLKNDKVLGKALSKMHERLEAKGIGPNSKGMQKLKNLKKPSESIQKIRNEAFFSRKN